jgi:NAD(P) transhydrogenase subunit alpha
MDFISILSIFVLACFVGYYVVWSVTPALHTPLMAVTNAISSVIIVGALIAAAAVGPSVMHNRLVVAPDGATSVNGQRLSPAEAEAMFAGPESAVAAVAAHPPAGPAVSAPTGAAKWLGLIAVVLASVNIFGGFAVTARMLAMYKKKER